MEGPNRVLRRDSAAGRNQSKKSEDEDEDEDEKENLRRQTTSAPLDTDVPGWLRVLAWPYAAGRTWLGRTWAFSPGEGETVAAAVEKPAADSRGSQRPDIWVRFANGNTAQGLDELISIGVW